MHPDFKAIYRPALDDRLASKKIHIEENFYILKRNKQTNQSEDCECQCAFGSISFKSFNSTQMRVHLTGESQGSIVVAPCKNVLAACQDFYAAERDHEAAKSRELEMEVVKTTMMQLNLAGLKLKEKKTAEEEPVMDVNPCTLTMTNFKHVDQIPITSMMSSEFNFFQVNRLHSNVIDAFVHACVLLFEHAKSMRVQLKQWMKQGQQLEE